MGRAGVAMLAAAAVVVGLGTFIYPGVFLPGLVLLVVLGLFAGTHGQFLQLRQPADPVVIPMLLLPVAYGMRAVLTEHRELLLLLLLLVLAIGKARFKIEPLTLAALGVTFFMVLLHPVDGRYRELSVLVLLILYLTVRRYPPRALVASLVDGVGLYVVANVVGYYVLGYRSPAAVYRTAGLESITGGERVFFPLAYSLATVPTMAAIFIASAAIFYERGFNRNVLRSVAFAASALVLVAADARASLLIAAAVATASILRPTWLRRAAVPAGVLALVLAFVYPNIARPVVLPAIEHVTAAVPQLERSGEAGNTSLNGREFIWERSLDFWQRDVSSSSHSITGFGAQGQMTSGASATYAIVFAGGFTNPRTAATHNSALQQLYDAGYLGLAAFVLLVFQTLWRWSRSHLGVYGHVALAASVAVVLSGATEVMTVPGYAHDPLWILVALALIAASRPRAGEAETAEQAAAEEVRV